MNNLAGTWVIDPTNSNVTFSVRHLLSKVTGSFGEIQGEANVLEDISDSTVYGVVDVTTITTDDEDRDERIRSHEFFDVANYPTITFKTNRWNVSEASDEITLEGELTIKEVTKPVTFTGEFKQVEVSASGRTEAALTLTTEIDRKDWGLTWGAAAEAGGLILGDEVSIRVDALAVLADDTPEVLAEPRVPDEPETPVFV